ncbi:uncharacterized protein LOC116844216 isoform X8 [Odontomachus brunneus]|uniref:uncharacterized protein LOC116844216 isoform X8 n=1 Tax=Odontomachus brunneus TaxID=486640 RepID=UPI0013F23070|nr:uncharacterized protein LOC116844216 isoform X8 [Odontomachus brunneus]
MASYIEITLLDAETNEAYKIVVSPEDAKRAESDLEFATKLLERARSNTKNITKRRGNLFLLLFLTHTGHFEGIRPEWPDRSQVRVPAYVTNSGCLR